MHMSLKQPNVFLLLEVDTFLHSIILVKINNNFFYQPSNSHLLYNSNNDDLH